MTDAERVEELEAYIKMLEMDFEAKVDRAIESRLPHEVDKEITRRETQATFERSKAAAQRLKAQLVVSGNMSKKSLMDEMGIKLEDELFDV